MITLVKFALVLIGQAGFIARVCIITAGVISEASLHFRKGFHVSYNFRYISEVCKPCSLLSYLRTWEFLKTLDNVFRDRVYIIQRGSW